jgi:hypothetical protein
MYKTHWRFKLLICFSLFEERNRDLRVYFIISNLINGKINIISLFNNQTISWNTVLISSLFRDLSRFVVCCRCFGDNLSVTFLMVLKMGKISCAETSVNTNLRWVTSQKKKIPFTLRRKPKVTQSIILVFFIYSWYTMGSVGTSGELWSSGQDLPRLVR